MDSPRNQITLGRDVNSPPSPPAARVKHLRERDRCELASLNGHQRARSAREEVGHRGVAKIARVLGVERDRRDAPQLVTDRLVHDRHFDSALLEPHLDFVLHLPTEVNFRDPDVALGVAVHVLQFRHFARAESLDKGFGKEGDPVRLPHRPTLDDAPLDDVGDVGERDQFFGNSSGMIVHVALTAFPIPSVKCPVGRPIVTPKYQRPVVLASSMRFLTMPTPA